MFVRKLYRLREAFQNPNADRRSLLNVNLAPGLPKGTYVVEKPDAQVSGPWKVIGWNQSPPRRELIDRLKPLMEEVPVTTLAHVKMLYHGDVGAPDRFLEELVKQGRVTVAEYVEFLSRTPNE